MNKPAKTSWNEISQIIRKLAPILTDLEKAIGQVAGTFQLKSIALYRNKLNIVMSDTVVIAVLGGVKAGKSTVFQSICGDLNVAATGVAHLTHRPLAFTPKKLQPPDLNLQNLFPEFEIQITANPESATQQNVPPNRLWVMTAKNAASGTITIDCPDLNSMNRINRDLAFQLAKCSDIIVLVMLGGASAYSAEIKSFACEALQMGRIIIPVLTKMDNEQAAQIVLDEFKKEMAPLLNDQLPQFRLAYFVPPVPLSQRSNLRKLRLRPLQQADFPQFSQPAKRSEVKATVWHHTYRQFRQQLSNELSAIQLESKTWLNYWPQIEQVIDDWSQNVARSIFPRSIVLRELIDWFEDTKLTPVRRILRKVNPVNWPSQLYGLIRKQLLSQRERHELQEQAQHATEKLRRQLDTDANHAWVKIWGQDAPQKADFIEKWVSNHQANPIIFSKVCKDIVQRSLLAPHFSPQWKENFRKDLDRWWQSDDEDSRQKRKILEYSQISWDFISWLALPVTFFFPGTVDTLIVGVTQPILTFINNHFLFIESHFAGARQQWIQTEALRLKKELFEKEENLSALVQYIQQWKQTQFAMKKLSALFYQIDEKLESILAESTSR